MLVLKLGGVPTQCVSVCALMEHTCLMGQEDHDSRPLKFDERMRMADNNKREVLLRTVVA